MCVKPHISNTLPGDTGASGHGPQFEGARPYRAVQRGAVGWAALSADNCGVVWGPRSRRNHGEGVREPGYESSVSPLTPWPLSLIEFG